MEPEKKSNGALVGLVVIIVILIAGGIYIWLSNKNTLEESPVNSKAVTSQDSADLDALDQDLNTANIDVGASAIGSVQ